MLATAQGGAVPPAGADEVGGEGEGNGTLPGQNAGTAATPNVRTLAAGNSPSKKLQSPGTLTGTGGVAGGNIAMAVAGFVPVPVLVPANPVSSGGQLNALQLSISQGSIPQAVTPQMSAPQEGAPQENPVQSNLTPVLPAAQSLPNPAAGPQSIPSGWQTAANAVAFKGATQWIAVASAMPVQPPGQTGNGNFDSSIGSSSTSGGTAENLDSLSKPGATLPSQRIGLAIARDSAEANATQAPRAASESGTAFDKVLPDTNLMASPISTPISAPAVASVSTPVPALASIMSAQSAPNNLLSNNFANVTSDLEGSGPQADGLGGDAAQMQTSATIESSVATLIASNFWPTEEMSSATSAGSQLAQAKPVSAAAVAAQIPLPPETNVGNPVSSMAVPGTSVSSTSVSGIVASQQILGKAGLRVGAPKVAAGVATPNVRAAGAGQVSTTSATLAAESDTGAGLPIASQTPFSIFFSSPGPGADSAASVLPKMMLPATGAAIHGSSVMAATPGNGAQTGGLQGNAVPNSITQGPANQANANKDALPATPGTNAQTGQLRPDAGSNAANTPVVSAPAPAALPATAQASVAAPLLMGGQPAGPGDSLPKQNVAPGAATGGSANLPPAAPQMPPAALAGPVQVAQVLTRMGQSEMRIGLNTSAFGSVDVRTVVHASEVGVVIGSEKGDLRGLLANEMPALTNTLQQQNLRLSSVSFVPDFSSANNGSPGGHSQQRSFVPPSANAAPSAAIAEEPMEIPPQRIYGGAGSGLSILA